ncbi:MAG TPA: hypothetical protein VFV38_09625 [Ktedonobacteraceae bacterium]|nr:hypothetical protein [Ktedonobacteraceae bacterium]
MSMNEFEKQKNTRDKEFFSLSVENGAFPGDFTEEDLDFAEELNALFSPETEELPPYYVQTLLNGDDQRFDPVERGFEHKTSARVFRRLKLRRRLFYTHLSPLSAFGANVGNVAMRRSLLALLATFVLLMMLTVAFTGGAFANGIAILLHGKHAGGVYQMDKYPPAGVVHHAQINWQTVPDASTKQISLLDAQRQMHAPLYSPFYIPSPYILAHINLYVGLDQQWADGPMLEFEYSLPPSAAAPKGMGEIWVREFKPKADVLQLVQEGASVPIEVDNNGRAQAIYVDGLWVKHGKNLPEWIYGQRSELIYQLNGVVFWIVGDQRDGIKEKQLMQIAQGLMLLPSDQQFRMAEEATAVTQMNEAVIGPFSNDVIVVFPDDGSDGPYYLSVSSYQPPKNVH